ncbi:hypothetical protein CEXT_743531 [Caerostris extrusa]|uniref:Uncharacterized protein n=1 Tax=Caerostris extrusa TaxID=172846 RepID=A0AAV4X7A5_CAEEX|nr:hypothetical protein CEXT_743531 [Caerostris extrusa]
MVEIAEACPKQVNYFLQRFILGNCSLVLKRMGLATVLFTTMNTPHWLAYSGNYDIDSFAGINASSNRFVHSGGCDTPELFTVVIFVTTYTNRDACELLICQQWLM